MASNDDILNEGGEGLILQQICSVYEHGKSQSLLKIKVNMIVFKYCSFLIVFRATRAIKKR